MIHVDGKQDDMVANNLTPCFLTHPGEVLKDELEYRGIKQRDLAEKMGISYKVLNDILNERHPVTVETAMLFEAALGVSAKTLLALQISCNIENARRNPTFLERLSRVSRKAAAL